MREWDREVLIEKPPPAVTLSEVRSHVRAHLEKTSVVRAILFGSYARGDADGVSDLDLVLIEETSLPFVERGFAHLPLFDLGIGIDLLVYTPVEYDRLRAEGNPLIERVETEGRTLYERSRAT